jgi:hypothetical protein
MAFLTDSKKILLDQIFPLKINGLDVEAAVSKAHF